MNDISETSKEDAEQICPYCKNKSKIKDWKCGEMPCELCGEHHAPICPICKTNVDSSYYDDILCGDPNCFDYYLE